MVDYGQMYTEDGGVEMLSFMDSFFPQKSRVVALVHS